jgi:hypothetical protein
MRDRTGFLYWLVAGAVVGFGLIGLMTIGYPFLIAGMILCVVGLWRPGIGGSWAFLIGLGGLPALFFLRHITDAALNPYCLEDLNSPGISVPPSAGTVSCSYAPASYYALFAIALSGVALYLLLRARSRDGATV